MLPCSIFSWATTKIFGWRTARRLKLYFIDDMLMTRFVYIRFTMEKEVDHKIPFLDVFIHSHSQGPTTTVFCKKTFTGLLTNYFSQESMKVREVIPYIDPVPIVIPLKLFLDHLRDPVFPRGYPIICPHFTNVVWEFAHLSTFVKMGTYTCN